MRRKLVVTLVAIFVVAYGSFAAMLAVFFAVFRLPPRIRRFAVPGTALAARTAKAANRFRGLFAEAGPRFAFRRPPAFAILDARRDPASATALRAGKASPK